MAAVGRFLKNAWNKEPIVMTASSIALLGIALVFSSPFTKYTSMMNEQMPYIYPVPIRDDGNMPDVPSHPCEPKGKRIEWL